GDGANEPEDVPCPNIYVPPILVAEMFDDVFAPIARDGASIVEVQIRLHKALQTLAKIGDEDFAANAARLAKRALARSENALELDEERDAVRKIAEETFRQAAARASRARFGGAGAAE
ncbi:MAG: DUF2254 domain-containing protein, partial [Xanthomonadaceae bacterium]|nr:DUF2254 domain-containing protein [Xanthomonadaceae bacterium]